MYYLKRSLCEQVFTSLFQQSLLLTKLDHGWEVGRLEGYNSVKELHEPRLFLCNLTKEVYDTLVH